MKKKIILFFILFALSLSLIPKVSAHADTTYYEIGSCYINNEGVYTLYCTNEVARYPMMNQSRYLYVKQGSTGSYGYPTYYYNPNNNSYNQVSVGLYCKSAYIISDQFTQVNLYNDVFGYYCYVYSNYDDYYQSIPEEYQPEIPSDPTWYEELMNLFVDYLGDFGFDALDGFIDWLGDLWTVRVGEGEDELALELITPTPTPTPVPTPTPIPYQTQLVPDGNGGFNITYIYPDPSGNPTSGPQPPTNQPQPTQVIVNNKWEYPYYENPTNQDDPYSFDVPWYLKFSFNGVTTSLSDFQDGMDAVVENVNDQDENISVVMDSMGLFPSDWLLMIGFIGAIPLVGGLISRLLKG